MKEIDATAVERILQTMMATSSELIESYAIKAQYGIIPVIGALVAMLFLAWAIWFGVSQGKKQNEAGLIAFSYAFGAGLLLISGVMLVDLTYTYLHHMAAPQAWVFEILVEALH